MAPSLDFPVSSLLCAEDTDSISYNDDSDYGDVEDYNNGFDWNMNLSKNQNLSMNLETEYSFLELPLQNDECLTLLTVKESEQFVGFVDYLNKLKNQNLFLVGRQEAVDWISKVCFDHFFNNCFGLHNLGLISCFVSAHKVTHFFFFLLRSGIYES